MEKFDRKLEILDGIETEYLRILYYDIDKIIKILINHMYIKEFA